MSAVLVNAVYFKGKWTTPFDKSETQDRNFTSATARQNPFPMMRQGGEFSYLETNDFQAVRLPYGNDSQACMSSCQSRASFRRMMQRCGEWKISQAA